DSPIDDVSVREVRLEFYLPGIASSARNNGIGLRAHQVDIARTVPCRLKSYPALRSPIVPGWLHLEIRGHGALSVALERGRDDRLSVDRDGVVDQGPVNVEGLTITAGNT